MAIERGGIEHTEFGNYLFGEIDVPTLETYNTPLQPFDPSRSLTLNTSTPSSPYSWGSSAPSSRGYARSWSPRAGCAETGRSQAVRQAGTGPSRPAQRGLLHAGPASPGYTRGDQPTGAAPALHGAGASGDQEADLWVEGLDQPGDRTPDTPSSDGGPAKGTVVPPHRSPDSATPPKTGSRWCLRLQVKASASGLRGGSASPSGTSAKAKTGRDLRLEQPHHHYQHGPPGARRGPQARRNRESPPAGGSHTRSRSPSMRSLSLTRR